MNNRTKTMLGIGAAIGAWYYGRSLIRKSRHFSWIDKVAVVTGGSRGLGLVTARQLVKSGAKVAICSRTERDVDAALDQFAGAGNRVVGMVCDVRDREQVHGFVDSILETWGTVDLLFNVAGIMEVGPFDAMTIDDFYEAMDINCWGPLHMISAVLPTMRERGWGRIVNVASIGGKQAVPHMLPYSASKHALVGLSNGLRTELARDNILVTTACPTLMRTGSPRNALFKSRHRHEFTWFDIGASLPFVSLDAEQAARQILTACQNGDGEVFISNFLNPATWAARCAPELTTEILAIANRLLPSLGGIGQESAKGYESESAIAPSWLTTLSDTAAELNNEMNEGPEFVPPRKG